MDHKELEIFFNKHIMWKKNELKDPSEYGYEITSDILKLIEDFSRDTKIKIEDTQQIAAYTPNKNTIVLSRGTLNKFKTSDIKVLVAHELGHIVSKDKLKDSNKVLIGRIILLTVTIICLSLLCYLINAILVIYVLFGAMLWIISLWIKNLSYDDEYRADDFVITKAFVSVESFAQCFSTVATILEEEYSIESPFMRLGQRLVNYYTHPSIKQRVSRARNNKDLRDL